MNKENSGLLRYAMFALLGVFIIILLYGILLVTMPVTFTSTPSTSTSDGIGIVGGGRFIMRR